MEKPKLKNRAAVKNSENCPRGALATSRRKYSSDGRIIWACLNPGPADRDNRSPGPDPDNEAHTHRQWRSSWLPPTASSESFPGAVGTVESTAGRLPWEAVAVRHEPTAAG